MTNFRDPTQWPNLTMDTSTSTSSSRSLFSLFQHTTHTCHSYQALATNTTRKMVYTMVYKVDGGCRRNGYSNAIGAAAAVEVQKYGGCKSWTQQLPRYQGFTPTSQRAEITAIILALELALEKYQQLDTNPRISLTIYSDSRYAVGCMTEWIYKWCRNGWVNAAGNPVVNQDLIQKASDLDDRVKELGSVTYQWISRESNSVADELCNNCLDEQE